jgi:hypothetical protein
VNRRGLHTALVLGALAAAGCSRVAARVAAPGGELDRAILDPYLGAQAMLASDTIDGVKAQAAALGAAARALGPEAATIDRASVRLASAADIADARVQFGALSQAFDGYVSEHHLSLPQGVRAAFCPMAMRTWLQKDGALRNPYYGSQMLTCGSFRN